MPGLVPGIHALRLLAGKDVDGRHEAGHDDSFKSYSGLHAL